MEPGTIFASMPLRVGDDYNDGAYAAAIWALFGLGLFKDQSAEATGNVLVVVVEERPTIADVEFAGTKEFDKEALKKSMRDVGPIEGFTARTRHWPTGRAGTQAPVHQQEPVRGRGGYHRDAH